MQPRLIKAGRFGVAAKTFRKVGSVLLPRLIKAGWFGVAAKTN